MCSRIESRPKRYH